MISRLFSRNPDTRVYFATDIHGSETCWRKFLNSGKHYEADVMVLGGDMTGMALIPKVEQGGVPAPPCSKTAMSSGTRRRSRSSRTPSGGVATTRSAPTRAR